MIRVDGDLRRIDLPALAHAAVLDLVSGVMNDAQRRDYEDRLETDFSFEIRGLARFRVNAFHQHRGAGAVFRTIPSRILTLEELHAPIIPADNRRHAAGRGAGHGADGLGQVDHSGCDDRPQECN